MPVFPLPWAGQSANVGAVTGSSIGTTITASASANTKGSYTQIVASTPFLTNWLLLEAMTNTNGSVMLVDVAIGAASSEQIIIGDLMVQGTRNNICVPLPITIPAGVRLSARCQAATGSQTCFVEATLLAAQYGMQPTGGIVTCYGQATGTSRGVSIDPGGTANTKGSYAQIVASTSRRARGFILLLGGQGNTAVTAGTWLFDVAIGAGGSEQVILSNWEVDVRGAGNVAPQPAWTPFIPIAIGNATRIAVRSQSTVIDATDRLLDAQIVAVS